MKSAVETLNPTRVKLTVEVPFDELKPSLDAAYQTIAGQISVPGFRKGKVPARIIDQRIGRGAVIEQAVNDALPQLYMQAVQQEAVRPLGQPQVDVTDVPDPSAGGDLKFTVEVDVRPTIELPELDGVQVTVDDVVVGEEQVQERLDSLRERFGTLSTVDRPAVDGDFVTLDISAVIDGEPIDSVAGVSYRIGSNEMLPGMDDVLPSLSAGESTTYTTALVGGDRAGQEAQVSLTVQAVKERSLPEVDDDFAQLASEFDTLDELRVDLRNQAEQLARYQQAMQARERLVEVLLDSIDIPVPDAAVQAEVTQHLEQEGKPADDPHGEEVAVQARRAIQAQLLLDAVAEKFEVRVGQQELIEFMIASAQQYQMDPNQFVQAVDQAGQIPQMVGEVGRRKALAELLEKAVVSDASGNRIELSELFAQDDSDDQADDAQTDEQTDEQAIEASDDKPVTEGAAS